MKGTAMSVTIATARANKNYKKMVLATEEKTSEVAGKTLNEKQESKKEVTVAFQVEVKKIEEAKEIPSQSVEGRRKTSNGSQVTRGNAERPKSAGNLSRKGLGCGVTKRPKSSETFRSRIRKLDPELDVKEKVKQVFHIKELSSCRNGLRCECATLLDLDSRCSSLCGCRTRSCLCDYETDWWTSYSNYKVGTEGRRCGSNTSFSKTIFEKEKDLYKMKRSLRLLGLDLSDFGVYSSGRVQTILESKLKRNSSTFSTKVTGRSFSLEPLKQEIRRAWLEDRLDESHRKLLSQAAYEEWYFKKEKELQQKQEEEKKRKTIAKENMQKDFERKKAKAEEEFRKWMQRKRIKRKEKENLEKPSEHRLDRFKKTKQDSEAAFLKWKKEKDKELEKKKHQKRKAEEKKMESERRRQEKKTIAEKAFQQWKVKLEETQKLEEERKKEMKRKQEEFKVRQKQEERSQISFQIWKKTKDQEVRQQMKQIREMTKLEKEERQMRMEERMYEAEQAFEDWLVKVDSRKQKHFCDRFQKIPWIPV